MGNSYEQEIYRSENLKVHHQKVSSFTDRGNWFDTCEVVTVSELVELWGDRTPAVALMVATDIIRTLPA